MKIGIDYHGVIETNPEFFKFFCGEIRTFDIHIISGLPLNILSSKLEELGIYLDHAYSITDDLLAKGVYHTICPKTGRPIFPDIEWNTAKARYCEENKIDLMIDDNAEYLKYFNTPCVLWKRIK